MGQPLSIEGQYPPHFSLSIGHLQRTLAVYEIISASAVQAGGWERRSRPNHSRRENEFLRPRPIDTTPSRRPLDEPWIVFCREPAPQLTPLYHGLAFNPELQLNGVEL